MEPGGTGGVPAISPDAAPSSPAPTPDAAVSAGDDAAPAIGGAVDGGAAPGDGGGTPPSTSDDGGSPVLPPGLTSIFDGTLAGWNGDPKTWSIKDGAIHGITQNGGFLIKSKDDYDNFRFIGSARMLGTDLSQHLGICIWGAPAAPGSYGYSGCIEFTPGSGSYWDYGKCGAKNQTYQYATKPVWSQIELLANLTAGTVRVAINGHEVPGYKDCANSGHKKGPIGLQIHAHASEVEYKDMAVEVNPTEDKLLTVKP
jgi:hypothetical protein